MAEVAVASALTRSTGPRAVDNCSSRQTIFVTLLTTLIMYTMKIVVGLGNPGKEYARTRHNVGWMVLDAVRGDDRARLDFHFEKKWNADVAKTGDVVYCKPQTFMNRSGAAVRALMDFYKVELANVIVVYDDKDLPFGVVRLRSSGSSGGHNGVQSIIDLLGYTDFPRVRVGIASEEMHGDAADYVLARFSKEQENMLPDVVTAAAHAVQKILAEGITKQSHADIQV